MKVSDQVWLKLVSVANQIGTIDENRDEGSVTCMPKDCASFETNQEGYIEAKHELADKALSAVDLEGIVDVYIPESEYGRVDMCLLGDL